jgi:hypothetical protein
MPDTTTGVDVDGPFFEDLAVGWRFSGASGHTIDEGHAACSRPVLIQRACVD